RLILPNAIHGFCVFHQLKNVTRKYLDEFKRIENIPECELVIYGVILWLAFLSENAPIFSIFCMHPTEGEP
ncbi:MAG: hypothetical protein U9R21_05750, partial [Candidatus Thermoplasmatota archaeon]|nr:hypothetical protein [Candidatus Thermoplasmatota archaeon]